MQNQIKAAINKDIWLKVFEDMTPVQRRWAFVSVKMAERQKTFKDMAKRHRLGAGYLAECVQGVVKNGTTRRLTSQMKNALEVELAIDLGPFLSPEEAWKMMEEKNMAKYSKESAKK